jgi:hypothetical protein
VRGDNLNNQAIVILPSEALGGIDGALEITGVAIGTKHLVAFCKYSHRDELLLVRCFENLYALYAIISPDMQERPRYEAKKRNSRQDS